MYSHEFSIPLRPFRTVIGDMRIVVHAFREGRERRHRLMELVRNNGEDLDVLLTYIFPHEDIR